MENFLTTLAEINDKINAFIWVKIGLVLLIGLFPQIVTFLPTLMGVGG